MSQAPRSTPNELSALIDRLCEAGRYVIAPSNRDVRLAGGRRRARTGEEAYGELEPVAIDYLLDVLDVDETSTLLDVGVGTGQIIVRAAALTGATAIGVDIDAVLVDVARANVDVVRRQLRHRRLAMGVAHAFLADGTRPLGGGWLGDVHSVSHVFINNVVFHDHTTKDIIRQQVRSRRLVVGTRIVLVKALLWSPSDDDDDELFRHLEMPVRRLVPPAELERVMSWTSKWCIFSVYTLRSRDDSPSFRDDWRSAYRDELVRLKRPFGRNVI